MVLEPLLRRMTKKSFSLALKPFWGLMLSAGFAEGAAEKFQVAAVQDEVRENVVGAAVGRPAQPALFYDNRGRVALYAHFRVVRVHQRHGVLHNARVALPPVVDGQRRQGRPV